MTSEAPDTAAGREQRWPAILGTVAIVVGIIGVMVYGCCSFGSMVLQPGTLPDRGELTAIEREMITARMAVDQRFLLWKIFHQVIAATLGGVLAASGLMLHQRDVRGVMLMRIWARVRIGLALLAVVMYMIIGRMHWWAMQDVAADFDDSLPPVNTLMQWWLTLAPIVAGVWWCALPAAVLYWLRRTDVGDDVRAWGKGQPMPL